MTNTRPFTDAHAVVWVDFAIMFDRKLTSDELRRLESLFKDEMPKQGLVASASEADEETGRDDGGRLAFEKKDADGSIAEVLHIHENFVHVIQTEYRGWALTRDAAILLFSPLIDLLQTNELPAGCVGLAFRDSFLLDDPDEYEVGDVFKPNAYLPQSIFNAGPMWEIRSEWRESEVPEPWEIGMSRISVDAEIRRAPVAEAKNDDPTDFLHVTEITHRQQVLVGDLEDWPQIEWNREKIQDWLDYLHGKNKALMQALLTDAMLEKIGLKE